MTQIVREKRELQREVEERLAAHGLVKGPSRVTSTPPVAFDDESFALRLAAALKDLGPVWAALGRYFSTRLDLLTVHDALKLAHIPDEAPALPAEDVLEIVGTELGDPAAVFDSFDPEPRTSGITRQTHRARTKTGEDVLVRVVRPGFAAEADAALEAAAPLERIFAAYGRLPSLGSVLADFRRELGDRLDPRRETEALGLLAKSIDGEPLVVPRVHAPWTSAHVSVVEDLHGRPLGELAGKDGMDTVDGMDLARRLSLVWLRQALFSSVFPVEAEVLVLPDEHLAWTGGVFASLPAPAQVSLWDYLRATRNHDPDHAVACLLGELTRGRRAASEGELRSRMRQVVPFRDGGWSSSGEDLAEYAVLHWHVARDYGFSAPPHLAAFYRGLFWVARESRPYTLDRDPLGDALHDLEWMAGWNQFRQITAPGNMASTLESYLAGALQLPPRLDRALEAAGGEQRATKATGRTGEPRRTSRERTTAAAALVLGMSALALVARPLAQQATFGERTEAAVALVFAAFALTLLLALSRTS